MRLSRGCALRGVRDAIGSIDDQLRGHLLRDLVCGLDHQCCRQLTLNSVQLLQKDRYVSVVCGNLSNFCGNLSDDEDFLAL